MFQAHMWTSPSLLGSRWWPPCGGSFSQGDKNETTPESLAVWVCFITRPIGAACGIPGGPSAGVAETRRIGISRTREGRANDAAEAIDHSRAIEPASGNQSVAG